eukprot:scaffold19755_cov151-Skeletonema_dohrnii-CCMP3373.AAC.1
MFLREYSSQHHDDDESSVRVSARAAKIFFTFRADASGSAACTIAMYNLSGYPSETHVWKSNFIDRYSYKRNLTGNWHMHAHQSKAPRATLQHTHTYSTHSTAGTDQFIPVVARRSK